MTSSNSPEAVADPASSSAAAPYGTRSRGRNAPRPNYAEDRDIDMELEAPAKTGKRSSGVGLNTANGSKSDDSEKSSPTQPRKSLTNGAAINAIPKESIPGTSSFSSRPEEVNGTGSLRKRKHPGSITNGSSAKRVFTGTPGDSEDGYFTNMVSFEESEPFLKNGQLIADDGTTFAVNGQFLQFFAIFPPLRLYAAPTREMKNQAPPKLSDTVLTPQFRSRLFNL